MTEHSLHDVVIIGAGVAGVSAAIECFDIQLDVVLLEGAGKVGGQIEEIPHTVRNVAVAPEGNRALVEALSHHAATLGPRLVVDRPVSEVDVDRGFVAAGSDRYRARIVLVTTGSVRRQLEGVPDGSFGGDVTYLVEPRLEHFARRPVAVFGGGDSAVLDALALSDTGSSVFLIHRAPVLSARRDIAQRLRSDRGITNMGGWTLERLVGSDRLAGVEVTNCTTGERRSLDVCRVVFKLGRQPRVELVRDQVELGRCGGIAVDAALRTSHPRTFAAGDVVDGAYERVATAAGQGSFVAHSILHFLQSQ